MFKPIEWVRSFFKTIFAEANRSSKQKLRSRSFWFTDLPATPGQLAEPGIKSWDLFGIGYPSSLRIDVPNLWAADPDIKKLSLGLTTTLSSVAVQRVQRLPLLPMAWEVWS